MYITLVFLSSSYIYVNRHVFAVTLCNIFEILYRVIVARDQQADGTRKHLKKIEANLNAPQERTTVVGKKKWGLHFDLAS